MSAGGQDPDAAPGAPPTVADVEWGRVDAAGEVWVRTADGERSVGSWQAAEPAAGLAFFVRRYADLATQVALLEQRLASGAASPDDAAATARRLRGEVTGAQAVGDLDALAARLDAVGAVVEQRRAEKRAARADELAAARATKETVVTDAETVAQGSDWRHGADRLRALLDRWKALPRLDRVTDDELWRRFSAARTTYTRRRRHHVAELAEQRGAVRAVKEQIVGEAEESASSTQWAQGAGRYRDLMSRWKAAGTAGRDADDQLWQRFKAAQDRFFAARGAALAERGASQRGALEARQALLAEAESLLPVSDPRAARAALRSVQDRWEAAAPVPRDAARGLESRLRRVEEAVRDAEGGQRRRTDPTARAWAADTVAKLQAAIAGLERALAAAREADDEGRAGEARDALEARRAWLEQAERALADFS